MSVPCPTEPELKAFSVGDLPTGAMQDVERHIDACQHCQAVLERLDSYRDGLVTELVHSTTATPASVPERVLVSARAVIFAEDVPPTPEPTFDTGRHFARLLESGPCRLGRFELLDELGMGSFGYVFRARDVELDRIVAIKVQRTGAFATLEDVGRFLREARSAAALAHPAIVALYDTGQTSDGVCYLVTEYVDGETLEERLKRGRLDQATATALVSELAAATHHAHQHGVVHRDLKPSNIMLDRAGHPHITDFGLAKRVESAEPSMTSAGRVMGTPAYMSPEQAAGSDDVDARTDVYSLGVLLYELLTGERPFQGTPRVLLLQVLEDEPRPPRKLESRIPRDLETICLKAMAKKPARRYQTAAHLADDLGRFQRGEPIEARPMSPAERLWRWCRRYPVAVALLAAVTLGSVIGLGYLTHLSTYFVQETALDSTRIEADMLESVNEYYSEDVLKRIDGRAINITHEYATLPNALPLPATFMIDACERISRAQSGQQFRLYSNYPWREGGGPKDDFQRDALAVLTERSRSQDAPRPLEYHAFVSIDDRPLLQYARAQIMKESCVKCHNGHPKSPKKDWKEGELVGVLLITRPLDRDIARTQSGLNSAFVLMGITAAIIVVGAVAAMRTRR
jgi:serine/threonine protein kinase